MTDDITGEVAIVTGASRGLGLALARELAARAARLVIFPYCTAKFAAVAFSEGLRAELGAAPVTVTTAVPGLMRTGSHLHALFRGQREKEFTWFSLDARRIFDRVTALGRSAARRLNEIPDEPESAETGHRS